MFPTTAAMSNSTSLSQEATVSSGTRLQKLAASLNHVVSSSTIPPPPPPQQLPQKIKKKRNLPGNPDPDAEVIALSPKSLLATNRFVCEVCNKGFQRDQNLQLHRRGHNLPWKLKQRNSKEVKKRAYVCPEPSCVHHNPSRALGDLTGIKKHYCRKHGEKKWKCHKCSKIYAVQSDWRAHSKTCGTREYRCDCGTLFCRKDSFITHRAFCDALAEESARVTAKQIEIGSTNPVLQIQSLMGMAFQCQNQIYANPWDPSQENPNPRSSTLGQAQSFQSQSQIPTSWLQEQEQQQQQHKSVINSPLRTLNLHMPSSADTSPHLSATALLQKAATVGATAIPGPAVGPHSTMGHVAQNQPRLPEFGVGPLNQMDSDSVGHHYMRGFMSRSLKSERLTRDFLGLTADANGGGNGGAVDVSVSAGGMLSFTGGVEYLPIPYVDHHSLFKSQQGFGLLGTTTAPETWGNA